MSRQNFSSGTQWESLAGYSRAVRIGNQAWISGTTATDENGAIVGPGDPYTQTIQALGNIDSALEQAGLKMTDVVRTRIYVVGIAANWQDVARAHGEVFEQIQPAATMVGVAGLVEPTMLVEIEVEAVKDE